MKNQLLLVLLLVSINIQSQIEVPLDSMKKLEKDFPKLDKKVGQYGDLTITSESNKQLKQQTILFEPIQKNDFSNINLNLPPIDVYLGPPIESNTFTKYPFANDYMFYSGLILSDKAWLSSSSYQNTYPLVGAVRSVNLNMNYQPATWLIISGGSYGAKYNLGGNAYNDVGANGAIKFIPHDRIRFNGYGQYAVYGKNNHVQGMMGMFPQTYYGGSIELKITEKIGVEGGVIRELNPLNGKWVNRTFIAPVFY